MTQMTATDAARAFSEVLNRVAKGEEIEVTRSGAAVAVISPPKSRLISAARFRELIGAHDLWIAATALAHGMGVATANPRDFRRVPGLRVLAAAE